MLFISFHTDCSERLLIAFQLAYKPTPIIMSLNCPLLTLIEEKVDLAYFMISLITHLVKAVGGGSFKDVCLGSSVWERQSLPHYNP